MAEPPPPKRARLNSRDNQAADIRAKRSAFLSSLSRPVSPPSASKDVLPSLQRKVTGPSAVGISTKSRARCEPIACPKEQKSRVQRLSSPFQLTRVKGLPPQDNIDTINLHDILGDPLIREAWIFNFCFDLNWTMQHFDADVRSSVNVKIIHGSWKQEDGNRQGIEEDMKSWKNVEDVKAYLPDPFGTHHSKMIILFKHDDTAQVVIHSANMLEKDWEHMTQAVWRSPALPLLGDVATNRIDDQVGGGAVFKVDLLRYIKVYGSKLKPLAEQLHKHDFSQVRAALIASVPCRVRVSDSRARTWGHLALRKTLQTLASERDEPSTLLAIDGSHLITQISSIATLSKFYLEETLFKAASPSGSSIIYPTPTDMRSALTGYATGGSIHTKIQTAANQSQVSRLRPHLNRWGAQSTDVSTRAGRHMIPPHIKTYINFTSKPTIEDPTPDISWALLTSANLSQQAWGSTPKLPKGVIAPSEAIVHVQSFEIGILVWPELFANDDGSEDLDVKKKANARMVPVFGNDIPATANRLNSKEDEDEGVVVGLRMPYDLPLTPYGADEMPWSPGEIYSDRDRLGHSWPP